VQKKIGSNDYAAALCWDIFNNNNNNKKKKEKRFFLSVPMITH
jgi:hypothetical protein